MSWTNQTVTDVIQGLESMHDARLDFWQKIDLLLTEKRYEEAWSMILDHRDDCDFNEQVEIVSRTIANYTKSENVVPSRDV